MPELPTEIWKERIKNELNILTEMGVVDERSIIWENNGVELWIKIDAMGFIKQYEDSKLIISPKKRHKIFIKINRSFPYPGGIDFLWYSNIFHPNIHPVELYETNSNGTGYICLNVLRKWSKLTDLETTIKALIKLVENPNPEDPLQYDLCTEAAEYFTNNPIDKVLKKHKNL